MEKETIRSEQIPDGIQVCLLSDLSGQQTPISTCLLKKLGIDRQYVNYKRKNLLWRLNPKITKGGRETLC
jgi:hypothetical protein